MYSIKKGIIFDDLDSETKECIRCLGFKEGDNLSEIFQKTLDDMEISLDEYISHCSYINLDKEMFSKFKVSQTAMTINSAVQIDDVDIINDIKLFDARDKKRNLVKNVDSFLSNKVLTHFGGDSSNNVRYAA